MRRLFLLFPLICLVILACGDDTPGPDERTLRSQLAEEWTAFVEQDWPALYTMTTAQQRAGCTLEEWTERMVSLPEIYGDSLNAARVQITDVKIKGDRATFTAVLIIDGQAREADTSEVVWEEGRWREAELDPC